MEKVTVSYTLGLTGSRFFDAVIYSRAKELAESYPELKLEMEKGKALHLTGTLDANIAAQLNEELAMYEGEEE